MMTACIIRSIMTRRIAKLGTRGVMQDLILKRRTSFHLTHSIRSHTPHKLQGNKPIPFSICPIILLRVPSSSIAHLHGHPQYIPIIVLSTFLFWLLSNLYSHCWASTTCNNIILHSCYKNRHLATS